MTQPPSGPPQGPPWGGYPPPGGQPSGSSRGLLIFLGVVIGGFATFVLPVIAIPVGEVVGLGLGAIIAALLLVPIAGIGLLFSDSTRPWGVGILIGWAIVLIVVGGACVALLSSLP